ncbi:hypothetical protein IJO12_02340 [bacterium]|nr:hypothetical protein [bacterium]
MTFLDILLQPAILIITACFLFFFLITVKNYIYIKNNLKSVYLFLQTLDKKEVIYRYNDLENFLLSNKCTCTAWEDMRKALIFPDKLYNITAENIAGLNYTPEIYLSVDSSFFMNEDSLVHSKINYKFIQSIPTLLTGMGPFFTFMKMAIAFSKVDFTSKEITSSLSVLIGNIQIAALCSVFAVGYSLLYIVLEKLIYNICCKKYYLLIQKEFIRLFDICTSEQFLLDLVKEVKLQSSGNIKFFKDITKDFSDSVSKTMSEHTTPYLENILYSLNKLNENIVKSSGGNSDIVDKLF